MTKTIESSLDDAYLLVAKTIADAASCLDFLKNEPAAPGTPAYIFQKEARADAAYLSAALHDIAGTLSAGRMDEIYRPQDDDIAADAAELARVA